MVKIPKVRVKERLQPIRSAISALRRPEDRTPPPVPEGLEREVVPVVEAGIRHMLEYQSVGYADLYVDRISRFIGRPEIDANLHAEIARLLAMRMAFRDPIRVAQRRLAEVDGAPPDPDIRSGARFIWFSLAEVVALLPALVADILIPVIETLGWRDVQVPVWLDISGPIGIRALRLLAWFRRFRLRSVRYPKERAAVERWLHMIDRALVKRPDAVHEVVKSAEIIHGYGKRYSQTLANWHLLIDAVAKPVFDGKEKIADLPAAMADARAAAVSDPTGAALRRTIDDIKARETARAAAPALQPF
ncbi:MAG: DUF6537 domain-containing protein [Pseudomonadota bacterium]